MLSLYASVAALGQLVLASEGAPAADAVGPMASLTSVVPFVLSFAVVYVLIIMPGNKQRREQAALSGSLQKGDEVVTQAGIYGRIAALEEKVVTLEIADKVKIRILRDRIGGRIQATPTPITTPATASK